MKIVPMRTGAAGAKSLSEHRNPPNPTIIDLDSDRKARQRNKNSQNRLRFRMMPDPEEREEMLAAEDLLDDWEGTVQVIALDPGGTTGWSLFEVHPEAVSGLPEHRKVSVLKNVVRWKHGQIDCGTTRGDRDLGALAGGISFTGENAGVGEILGLIRNYPNAAVIIEDFIIDSNRLSTDRDFLSPVRITSGVSYDLWLQNREYHLQSPSLAKTTAADPQLKAWGFYNRHGALRHARDADRHALTFLKRASAVGRSGYAMRSTAWPGIFGKGAKFSEMRSRDEARNDGAGNEANGTPVPESAKTVVAQGDTA